MIAHTMLAVADGNRATVGESFRLLYVALRGHQRR